MDPTTAKLLYVGLQLGKEALRLIEQARNNPTMTEAEADQLVADTQRRAADTVSRWREADAG